MCLPSFYAKSSRTSVRRSESFCTTDERSVRSDERPTLEPCAAGPWSGGVKVEPGPKASSSSSYSYSYSHGAVPTEHFPMSKDQGQMTRKAKTPECGEAPRSSPRIWGLALGASLVIGPWSFVLGHRSLVIGPWSSVLPPPKVPAPLHLPSDSPNTCCRTHLPPVCRKKSLPRPPLHPFPGAGLEVIAKSSPLTLPDNFFFLLLYGEFGKTNLLQALLVTPIPCPPSKHPPEPRPRASVFLLINSVSPRSSHPSRCDSQSRGFGARLRRGSGLV